MRNFPFLLFLSTIVCINGYERITETQTFNVTRSQNEELISNVKTSEECLHLKNTVWTGMKCKCQNKHIFYVVDEKAGCYNATTIDKDCTLSTSDEMVTTNDQTFLFTFTTLNDEDKDGSEVTKNCSQFMQTHINENGQWLFQHMNASSKMMSTKESGMLIRVTLQCNDNQEKCLILTTPGEYQFDFTYYLQNTTVATTDVTSATTTQLTTNTTRTTTQQQSNEISAIQQQSNNTILTTTTQQTHGNTTRKQEITTTVTTLQQTANTTTPDDTTKTLPPYTTMLFENDQTEEQKKTKKKLIIALCVCSVLLATVVVMAIVMAKRYLKIKRMTTDAEVARLHNPVKDESNSPK